MAHAERCPVCNGSGKRLERPPRECTLATPIIYTCHGCGGLGWITVQDSPIDDLEITGGDVEIKIDVPQT